MPAANAISYIENRKGISNIWVQPIDSGPAQQLTRFTSGRIYSFDWSADGRHLYYYELSPSHSFRRIGIDGGRSSEVVAGWTWEVNYGARVDSRQKFILYSEEHAAVPVGIIKRR